MYHNELKATRSLVDKAELPGCSFVHRDPENFALQEE